MSKIPQTFLDDLLARVDIVEIIDHRVKLKKVGSNYRARCPFHNEKTPSFTVNPQKQIYRCFGCGQGGNVIGFLMAYDRLEFREAVETLAAQVGLSIPHHITLEKASNKHLYSLLENVAEHYQQELNRIPSAINYLQQRGLSSEIIKRFGLGYASSGWDNLIKRFSNNNKNLITTGMLIQGDTNRRPYDRFRDRIIFPIRDTRGRIIGFGGRALGDDEPKYLNSPETPVFHKGYELYGLYEALQVDRQLSKFVIVEGYMDVIALAQYGVHYVGATLGTATSQRHLQKLFRYTQEVIFCFDGDRAGQAAAWRALTTSLPLMRDGLQMRFMFLPDGEDPDSIIRKEGVEAFEKRIQSAEPLADFFFAALASQADVNTIHGKAKLSQLAKEHLDRMPNGVYKELLLQRLSEMIKMDVRAIFHNPQSQASVPKPSSIRTPMRSAIALLLQHPALAKQVDITEIRELDLPGCDLLLALFRLIQEHPDVTTGSLLEYWRDTSFNKFMTTLASSELIIPEHGLLPELEGVIAKLKSQAFEGRIKQLFAKANESGLSSDEKQLLQALIAERNSVNSTC